MVKVQGNAVPEPPVVEIQGCHRTLTTTCLVSQNWRTVPSPVMFHWLSKLASRVTVLLLWCLIQGDFWRTQVRQPSRWQSSLRWVTTCSRRLRLFIRRKESLYHIEHFCHVLYLPRFNLSV